MDQVIELPRIGAISDTASSLMQINVRGSNVPTNARVPTLPEECHG